MTLVTPIGSSHGCIGNPCWICFPQLNPFRNTPYQYPTTAPGTGHPDMIVCPCNTINDFPQRCPYHDPDYVPEPRTYTTNKVELIPGWVTTTPALSDNDVDRIADRVIEKLTKAKAKARPRRRKK